jgi:hypothetical protein
MSKLLIRKEWNKREVISLTEEQFNQIIEGDSEEYDEEDREVEYYDLEKGYEDMKLVAKRLSDDKFFLFDYTCGDGEGIISKFPIEGKEVFPRTISTTIYE